VPSVRKEAAARFLEGEEMAYWKKGHAKEGDLAPMESFSRKIVKGGKLQL